MKLYSFEWLKHHVGKSTEHSPSPFGRWLNGLLLEAETGYVAVEYLVRPEMGNPLGGLHGGVSSAIIDEVIGMMLVTLDADHFYTSVNLAVDFIGNIRVGEKIITRAKLVRQGSKIVNAEAVIENENGALLAKATSNLVLTSIKMRN